MANTKSAKKRVKQNEVKRKTNLARKTAIKTAVKKVLDALKKKKAHEDVIVLMRDVESKLARAKGKGVVAKNAAKRKVSRLAKKVSAVSKKSKK